MSAVSLPALREEFSQFELASEQDSARNKFLASCGKYYEQVHVSEKSFLNSDRFFKQAQGIFREEIFSDHPGSLSRLKPLAQRYLEQWEAMAPSFRTGSDSLLSTRIDQFVLAHKEFVQHFIQEFKIVKKDTSAGAQLNSPKALKIFYLAAMEFLVSNPAVFSVAEEMIEEADPKLFDFLAYRAALIFLINDFSFDELPELFSPFESEIESLRQVYSTLKGSDKEILDKAIFMQTEEGFQIEALTKGGQELYRRIFAMIYAARDGENRSVFAVMNLALFEFFKKDFQIAKLLQHIPGLSELPTPAPHTELIKFLSQLSTFEYDQLKSIVFLPPQEKLLQIPLSEIEERKYFYRSAAIVALAQKLAVTAR